MSKRGPRGRFVSEFQWKNPSHWLHILYLLLKAHYELQAAEEREAAATMKDAGR